MGIAHAVHHVLGTKKAEASASVGAAARIEIADNGFAKLELLQSGDGGFPGGEFASLPISDDWLRAMGVSYAVHLALGFAEGEVSEASEESPGVVSVDVHHPLGIADRKLQGATAEDTGVDDASRWRCGRAAETVSEDGMGEGSMSTDGRALESTLSTSAEGGAGESVSIDGGGMDSGSTDGGEVDGRAVESASTDGGAVETSSSDGRAIQRMSADGGALESGSAYDRAAESVSTDAGAVESGTAEDRAAASLFAECGVVESSSRDDRVLIQSVSPNGRACGSCIMCDQFAWPCGDHANLESESAADQAAQSVSADGPAVESVSADSQVIERVPVDDVAVECLALDVGAVQVAAAEDEVDRDGGAVESGSADSQVIERVPVDGVAVECHVVDVGAAHGAAAEAECAFLDTESLAADSDAAESEVAEGEDVLADAVMPTVEEWVNEDDTSDVVAWKENLTRRIPLPRQVKNLMCEDVFGAPARCELRRCGSCPILVTAPHSLYLKRDGQKTHVVEVNTMDIASQLAKELGGCELQWTMAEKDRSEYFWKLGRQRRLRDGALLDPRNRDPNYLLVQELSTNRWHTLMRGVLLPWHKMSLHIDVHGCKNPPFTPSHLTVGLGAMLQRAERSGSQEEVAKVRAFGRSLKSDLSIMLSNMSSLHNLIMTSPKQRQAQLVRIVFPENAGEDYVRFCGALPAETGRLTQTQQAVEFMNFKHSVQLELSKSLRKALVEDESAAKRLAKALQAAWQKNR